MDRTPISMVTDSEDDIHVVCDDGTLWKLDPVSLDWRQVGGPIPDSPADDAGGSSGAGPL